MSQKKNLHSCDRTLTHHHQRPRATCGDSGARRDDRATMRAVLRTPGAVPLGATTGTPSTVVARRVLARAARSLDPIRDGRLVRRGRLIRRVGPNVRAPESRARAYDARAEREPDRDPRRYSSGAAAAAVALALLAETCAAPASASPLGHHVPAASHPRRRPETHLPATPRANPRPYPVLPHIASARTTEPVSTVVAAAAAAPAPAILAPSPPAPPDPAAVELGKVRADLKKETRAANRELARAEAARAAAAAEAAKAAEERRVALGAEQAARRAELDSRRRARRTLINDTTASAATGVFIVSALGTVWRSSGGSILVAAAIRNVVEGRAATKTVYAVRWDDPAAKPEGPDGLPATVAFKEFRGTLRDLKQAIADANGLPCGHTDVSHVAELEPNLRFLRPLRTVDDLHALPDHAWVLWSAAEAKVDRERRQGCELRPDEEENAYRFPAILPPQPPSRASGSAFGSAR